MNQPSLPEHISGLRLPDINLAKLSFCASKPAKVEEWANRFRATQTTETCVVLYQCLPEIARLKCHFDIRLEILEILRPVAQNAMESLTREFLQQPINLPENAQKKAIVAQAIQKSMIDGYGRCVVDICTQKRLKTPHLEALAKAIHRAVTGIGLLFFRSYQLYTHPPTGFWLQLHSYYQIAEHFNLLQTPVKDFLLRTRPATHIQTAYLRCLLMANARLNQLNRHDISHIYYALESWSGYVRLQPSVLREKDNVYLVNLSRDQGPSYKSRFDGGENDRVLELDIRVLIGQLAKQSPNHGDDAELAVVSPASGITVPPGFPATLLDHLTDSWSTIAQRRQERRSVHSSANISVGLVDTHYLIAGEQQFDAFADESQLARAMGSSVLDILTADLSVKDHQTANHTAADVTYEVDVQNVSAGGFCLLWKGAIPTKLKAGELVGIRQSGRHSWSVGVVRWVRQYRGESQLGIQTLANHPRPYAVAQSYDMGGYSDYMRALYLPATQNGRQSASLVTASAPFKELDKVKVFDGERAATAKLNKVIFATGSLQQFMFNTLDPAQGQTHTSSGAGRSHFDDDWD